MSSEFSFIHTLAPLGTQDSLKDSRNLKDDIAIIGKVSDDILVATKDIITENTHFFANDPLDKIIQKAIRVNISDLAAKSAKPYGMFLGLCLPERYNSPPHLKTIQSAISDECKLYNIPLLGGDTVQSDHLTISITLLGTCADMPADRKDAQINDDIYVTGTLGESAAGLYIRKNIYNCDKANSFLEKYLLPNPPLVLGIALRAYINASCDISDGFILDLKNILSQSHCGATLNYHNIPHASPFEDTDLNMSLALFGGDDYEILFTSSANEDDIQLLAKKFNHPITKVGQIIKGSDIINIPEKYKIIQSFEHI